ncbi:GspH/FimT family pseudopilin [Snodgrassella sp. ESL0253]|uniref:GspH/FimT family pseudopilin n=1 Tax=Snodgrassella sp. ESL0253 TaxID=2705031 RepID=UPI001584207E|nr:GspH/FimT family pseudopilin [Snodgrassella sp. ESL0253]NUE66879.1 prepilin-type N-terminal cleavage/methylation domain-containing protein [Snodgrassella sp. ESL0253]
MVSSKPTNAGFTLIELLIVIAITAVLAAIALPGMERLIASQRINNRADQMFALFQFARAEAIRTNKPILICPTVIKKSTADSNACSQFGNYQNGLGWQGFLAFNDSDMNGQYEATKDSSVRVVALNQNADNINKIKVLLRWRICNGNSATCNGNIANNDMLGFMPSGQFGIGNGPNANSWAIGQSTIIIDIIDSHYTNINRRLIITPGGKPVACYGQSSHNNTNSYCTL